MELEPLRTLAGRILEDRFYELKEDDKKFLCAIYGRQIAFGTDWQRSRVNALIASEAVRSATEVGLRVLKCSDPQMWYASRVGELVPFLGIWPEGFKSREAAGYVNIVRFSDAELEVLKPATECRDTEP